jgi:phage terminase small subunit
MFYGGKAFTGLDGLLALTAWTRPIIARGRTIMTLDGNYGRGIVDGMALTTQQETFAQAVVSLNNQQAAYRAAYTVGTATKWNTVSTEASRLAADPEVARRIQELRDLAAAAVCLPTASQRIAEMREVEQANPDEIIGIRWVNCRHCRGEGHGFQWRDDAEYAAACDAALAPGGKGKLPSMDGGFGFNGTLEPVGDCPICWGIGEQRPYVADTSKLSRGAARLYRGAKIKADGSIEILLADKSKYTDMLNRIQGIYKDSTAAMPPAATTATQVAAAKTPEERQRTYLRLVSGS